MHTIGTRWLWIGFFVFVIAVLAIDLFILDGKRSHRVSMREALSWSMVWFCCAMIFNGVLWWYLQQTAGPLVAQQKTLEFFTGYLIEESLSVDNMFAFILIFNYFAIPAELQRRVLLYGLLGAVIMRLLLILSGTWLVSQFHWVLYLFGIFLMITGGKMLLVKDNEASLDDNKLLKWLRSHIRMTSSLHGEMFFMKKNKLWYATPLFLVLVLIELSDVVFALDSIPAIFAITHDPFIVFTSNIFAILGLRALYFLLSNMAARFHLLRYGVGMVIVFIGVKMLIEPWIKIPITISLSVVVVVLATTVLLSGLSQWNKKRKSL